MEWNDVYKIKDSVDIYLIDESFILAYFMNTRKQKKFKITKEMITLFELIDGEKSVKDIYCALIDIYKYVAEEEFKNIFSKIIKTNIITKIIVNHILCNNDLERYDRQLNYFTEFLGDELSAEEAQDRLKKSIVSIFGCGAIGGTLAMQLAMAGIETFIIFDNDIVEESDISRHIYFKKEDIGRKKIEALGDVLKKINSNIKIYISDSYLFPETPLDEIITKSTFVIDTADEPYLGYTASIISELCVKQNKAHYIAGGFDAHLASTGELVIPYVTPCVACYTSYFLEKLKNWNPELHPVKIRDTEIGGLPSMSLFSTSFAALEILKYICGLTNIQESYKSRGEFIFDSMELVYLDPKRNPNCRVCGGSNE